MVAREVGEDGNIKWNAIRALLRKRMRRNFHHSFGRGVFYGVSKQTIQFQRLRRGVWRRENLPCNVIFDCANESGSAPGPIQNGFQQERGGALAIGAGYPCDRQLFCRVSVEIRAHARERLTAVGNLRPRKRCRLLSGIVGDDRNRARIDCPLNEAVAVARLASHRHEHVSRLHLARVVFDASD